MQQACLDERQCYVTVCEIPPGIHAGVEPATMSGWHCSIDFPYEFVELWHEDVDQRRVVGRRTVSFDDSDVGGSLFYLAGQSFPGGLIFVERFVGNVLCVDVEPTAAASVIDHSGTQMLLQSRKIRCDVSLHARVVMGQTLINIGALAVGDRYVGPERIGPPVAGPLGEMVGLDQPYVGVSEQEFNRFVHP